jgi:enoyl-[acyl-carrier protein] reductase II
VARGKLPIRQLKNAFSERYNAAERAGATQAELDALFKSSSLKQAALEGDVEWGKVERQSGLADDILPAEVVRRLIAELEEARERASAVSGAQNRG